MRMAQPSCARGGAHQLVGSAAEHAVGDAEHNRGRVVAAVSCRRGLSADTVAAPLNI